jgi:hypothetical protein
MNRAEIEKEVIYQRLIQKEKELIEIYVLYNECLLKIKELEEELNKNN